VKAEGLLTVKQRKIFFDFTHGKSVMELAVAVGQFASRWPWAIDVRAANAAHSSRFDQFEPILHTL
jgi:hypothetical protein